MTHCALDDAQSPVAAAHEAASVPHPPLMRVRSACTYAFSSLLIVHMPNCANASHALHTPVYRSTLSYGGAADFCGRQNHLLRHVMRSERAAQVSRRRGAGCGWAAMPHAAGRGRAPVVQRRQNLFEKEQEVIPEKHGSHVWRRGCCCCCCCCSEHLTQSSCW